MQRKLDELVVCPLRKFECFDDGDPEDTLMAALLRGQRRGYVNHWEQHMFEILDVEEDLGGHISAIVFSVLHEERRVYVFEEVLLTVRRPEPVTSQPMP